MRALLDTAPVARHDTKPVAGTTDGKPQTRTGYAIRLTYPTGTVRYLDGSLDLTPYQDRAHHFVCELAAIAAYGAFAREWIAAAGVCAWVCDVLRVDTATGTDDTDGTDGTCGGVP